MNCAHRRHDISDRIWSTIEKILPESEGKIGRKAFDNRLFINAVFWILRTGAPWRDLLSDYGDWKNTHRRFCRWRDARIWEGLFEMAICEPDLEWLMIDASHIKVHPHAAGAIGGNQEMGRTKGAQYTASS
jgi:transposase